MPAQLVHPYESDAPLKPAAARAAALWFVQLSAEDVSDADHRALEKWRNADPEHERAWQRTQLLGQQFSTLKPNAGMAALDRPASADRRRAVKHLTVLLLLGTTGLVAYQKKPWARGDYLTATGERRTITLADGTSLMLNTDTAVDIVYTPQERRISLRHGEIFIDTAKEDGAYRPLRVATPDGLLTALGTSFSVRRMDTRSRLAVEEGTVEIRPEATKENILLVRAGQMASFNHQQILDVSALDDMHMSWRSGVLLADRMRLGDFIAELSRYRSGVVRCDPSIAELEISGSFPLADTDRVLQSLVDTLPVKVSTLTRYWVQIGSA